MTRIQRHCGCALGLLAILYISAVVSVAQVSVDPFTVLPASDTLMVLDFKRLGSDVVPQLLVDEQEARALVLALPDPKTIELLDPKAIQRVIVGFHYTNAKDEKDSSDFQVVTVAQSSEAGQLSTLIRTKGAGKYREQQYAGKLLYITKVEPMEPKGEITAVTSSNQTEWAIVALDANTLVFGDPAYVRASVDVSTGKGTTVSADLVAAVKRNPKAVLSAAGLLPPALKSAVQELGNSDFTQIFSSLKGFYASVESTSTGLQAAVMLDTTSPEQTKSLVDLLGAIKTVAVGVGPGKTKRDKLARDLLKGLVISGVGTEVQIKDEITQASVNEFAKQFGAQMYYSQGLDQSQKGDLEAALAAYDKAILLEPGEANSFINRGKAQASKGNLDASIADYDKAIALDPESVLAYNNRCFERLQKGDFDAAIADCDKAIALDPTFAFAYNNRGFAFASQGKLDKALTDFDKSIALNGDNILAYQNRGGARLKTGNMDGAIADYEKVIALNAKSVDAYNGRGLARFYKGELDQAIADYDKAISINPNLAEVYGNRAVCLLALRKDKQAEQDLKKCYELNERLRLVFDPLVDEIKKKRKEKATNP